MRSLKKSNRKWFWSAKTCFCGFFEDSQLVELHLLNSLVKTAPRQRRDALRFGVFQQSL
jgi:hypothetical protein